MITSVSGMNLNAHWSPLYDTQVALIALVNYPAQVQFFNHTRGVNGRAVTNLERANEVVPPQRHEVLGIRAVLCTDTAATPGLLEDLVDLQRNYGVVMEVSGKTVFEGTFEYCVGGMGPYVAPQGTGAGLLDAAANGVPAASASVMFPERLAIPLEGGEPFTVRLEGTPFAMSASVGLAVRIYLEGIHFWPIN